MNCPIENSELAPFQQGAVSFHFCADCHGLFLTREEILGCLRAGNVRAGFPEPPRLRVETTRAVIQRRCPNCAGGTMVERKLDDIAIDLCPACHGVWLDAGELELILERHHRKHGSSEKGHADYSPAEAVADVAFNAPDIGDTASAVGEFIGDIASSAGDAGGGLLDFLSFFDL